MSKKMIWGLGVLMLLICTTFVYMTVRNLAEIRQLKQKADAIQKPSEDRNKTDTSIADNKPPPGASPNGHWHNGEWHDEAHDTPVGKKSHVPQNRNLNVGKVKVYPHPHHQDISTTGKKTVNIHYNQRMNPSLLA